MEPLPRARRRLYLTVFSLIFVIGLPITIFYADGWRFEPGIGLVRTGGIYISVPYSDARVTINDESVGESGFLQRSFYIDDLAPAAYVVRVEREGARSWRRVLIVEPQLVTSSDAILLPEEITLTELVISGSATGTRVVSDDVYASMIAAFATSTASSTLPLDKRGGVALMLEDGDILARWTENGQPPAVFCPSPSFCESEVSVKRFGGEAVDARFFGSGVVYRTKEGGIYFAEIDIRATPISAQIYGAEKTDMRIIDGSLIIKSGEALYEVSGL